MNALRFNAYRQRINRFAVRALGALSLAGALLATRAGATQVWTGPSITFSEPSTSDGTQPADQDRITSHVWLTRGLTMGLFNAEQESAYAHNFSPADTEWAFGEIADYASLSYTNWETWNDGNPPGMVGQDAVVHLISDDIYIAIQFTAWGMKMGGFTYMRSTAPPPSAPVFQSVAVSGGTVSLTWSAVTNQVYQLQYNTDLLSTNWVNLGNPVTATNTAITALDTNAAALSSQRFYRLLLSQ